MDRASLLANAFDVLPSLRERARDTETNRQISETTLKELREAGLFRVIQPAVWGGYELDPQVFLEIAMTLGSACGSTGWVYSILCVHSWELGCMSRTAQDEVWGSDPEVLISSSYAPTGTVQAVDGGYVVDGRWQFSSGCEHADWAFLGGRIAQEDGTARLSAFLVPRGDYEIEDVWHVIGLRGTGSNDVVLHDVFVPHHRVHPLTSGSEVSDSALFRIPFPSLFGYSLTAPVLGMAQGALQEHIEWTRRRTRKSGGNKVAEEVFSQIRVAEAANKIDGARALMMQTFTDMMAIGARGEDIPIDLRARARRDQVLGTRAAVDAIDQIFVNSGAHAIREDGEIQRFWRDAHAAELHNSNVAEPILSAYGAMQFGVTTAGAPF